MDPDTDIPPAGRARTIERWSAGPRAYAILSLLCLLLYLPGLASVPPLDRDEARFAQATKQMLESGDFIDIRFIDEARYKKPVGIYWLQAAFVAALSDVDAHEIWAYRLPSAIAAWMAVLMVYGAAVPLFGRRAAFAAALLLATATILILEAHQAKTDAVLLALVIAAQGLLARLYAGGRDGRDGGPLTIAQAAGFWIALGAAILIKGPIAPIVVGLTAATLAIWDGRWRWLGGLRPVWGIPLLLAVTLPWLIAIGVATNGAFFAEAIGGDLLAKVASGRESHGAPPGYHALLLLIAFWPASLFVYPALAGAWRRRDETGYRFAIAWAAPSWILFEAVATKLPHYTLPLYPALAWIAADALVRQDLFKSRVAKGYAVVWGLASAALAGAVFYAPFHLKMAFMPASAAVGALILVAAASGVIFAWRGHGKRGFASSAAFGGVALSAIVAFVLPSLEPLWLAQRVHDAIAAQGSRAIGAPIVAAGFREPSLVFLNGSDLAFDDGAGAARRLAEKPDTIAIVETREVSGFRDSANAIGLAPHEIARIDGLNYSRGQWTTLHLYGLRHISDISKR